uniref:Discs, large (Drosophila) homolog-associated protein 1a n=1 Tax=Neolamprologus brichardi TaxID=32507 RepID=A0A3Q4G2B9_NEOBR
MKGLSSSRGHHHVVSYEPSYDPLGHHVDRKPYLISQMDMPVPIPMPHPAELPYYNAQRTSYPSDSNSIVPYGTFPRRCHSTSSSHHPEVKDECYGGKTPTRVPANFVDPFERQPSFSRDGYHTLQYKRGVQAHSGGMGANNNNDSPGRIRHLVHSVQKLFTKSHSLEGPHHTQSSKGANNGSGGGGSRASPEGEAPPVGVRHRKRSKSRERCRSAEPKHRSSGYWSSDDNLERELYKFPQTPLPTSRSNNDVKYAASTALGLVDGPLVKKGPWSSSLTVSRAREVYTNNSSHNQALVKSKGSQQQERACHFLQVPQDEWSGFSPLGKEDDIPCRRMRSGSYVKAMAEDDSGDSDGSPKPSPKIQARRASYLKATQPSLTEMTTLQKSTKVGSVYLDVAFSEKRLVTHPSDFFSQLTAGFTNLLNNIFA